MGRCDSIFVNDFCFYSSLCVLNISASAVELCSGKDLWVGSDNFCQWFLILQLSMCGEDFNVSRGTGLL